MSGSGIKKRKKKEKKEEGKEKEEARARQFFLLLFFVQLFLFYYFYFLFLVDMSLPSREAPKLTDCTILASHSYKSRNPEFCSCDCPFLLLERHGRRKPKPSFFGDGIRQGQRLGHEREFETELTMSRSGISHCGSLQPFTRPTPALHSAPARHATDCECVLQYYYYYYYYFLIIHF